MTKSKKDLQLGMSASTASGRLVKDILWNYISKCGDNKCHKCGEDMSRDNFSIEHIIPWLDSGNALELFFDMNNISFSHIACNIRAARKPNRKFSSEEERNEAKTVAARERWRALPKEKQKEIRKDKYKRFKK